MEITTTQLIAGTYTAVGVMLIVALYHLILIFVDLRKIVKRFTNVSEHMESVVIKPLKVIETGIEWVTSYMASRTESSDDEEEEKPHHKKHSHHASHHEKKS